MYDSILAVWAITPFIIKLAVLSGRFMVRLTESDFDASNCALTNAYWVCLAAMAESVVAIKVYSVFSGLLENFALNSTMAWLMESISSVDM
ncbi:MAG: hypothetical protein H6536_06940 [Bacteroidales bacterium]|nr:hypothetical protein [Bacteroidales bacterium]